MSFKSSFFSLDSKFFSVILGVEKVSGNVRSFLIFKNVTMVAMAYVSAVISWSTPYNNLR